MHHEATAGRIRRALDFCKANECLLPTIAATMQQRRSAAADLAAQLDGASKSCDVRGLHVQLIALHARRHVRRAALEQEPSMSMADLTWLADFRLHIDGILADAAAHDPNSYDAIERAWNLLTWEDAVSSAADFIEPEPMAPIAAAAAHRREDALKIAAIFLCASVIAFVFHRPTGLMLGAVTAVIYTYVALLPSIRRTTTTNTLPAPTIRTVPELEALTHEELVELHRCIEAERTALIQRMEAAPCGDPLLDPYDVVEVPYP